MHKTKNLYLCLMALISITAFAGGYDEYGGSMNSGSSFWSTNVSNMVANNGGIPISGAPTTSYSYQQTTSTTVKSGTSYTVSSSPSTNPNQYSEYAGISSATGWQVWNIYPATTVTTTTQITVTLLGANTLMMNNYPPNTAFNYNVYDPVAHSTINNTYVSSNTGPVLVSSTSIPDNSSPVVTYDLIPRVIPAIINTSPNSPFTTAIQLYSQQSLTLPEAYKTIRDYIDIVIPDVTNGRKTYIENVIAKYANNFPEDQKPYAETIIIANVNVEIATVDSNSSTPVVAGKNYVFDENGNLKDSNTDGTSLIQIEINGVKKLPSELDTNDMSSRKAIAKIAVFLAKKVNAPIGSWFATGKHPNSQKSSSTAPAFTIPTDPYITVLNTRGGKFSTALDNIYSFTNTLQHELGHQFNEKSIPKIPNNLSTHVDVYIDAIEKTSFAQAPPNYRLGIILSLANYIWNMDKKPGYTFQQMKDRIDRFNGRSQFNGGYRLIVPKDPNNAQNILFIKGTLGTNNTNYIFKVYDPKTNTEVLPIFETNDEK